MFVTHDHTSYTKNWKAHFTVFFNIHFNLKIFNVMSSKCHLHIPPLITCTIYASCYYVYVISFCTYIREPLAMSVFFVLGLNFFFFMTMWSFFVTVYTPVATVPDAYRLTSEDLELLHNEPNVTSMLVVCANKNLELLTRTPRGLIRYCRHCKVIKPDRAHHCSKCGVCILKMDHHCPWLNNCIGFSTHKFFILTLFYTVLLCLYYVTTTLEYFINFWEFGENVILMPIAIGFIVAAFFGLLVGIFLVYHLGAIFQNETNIEKLFPTTFTNRLMTFDLGARHNFMEIFGTDWRLWLFPVYSTKGDGCNYSFNLKASSRIQAHNPHSRGSWTSLSSRVVRHSHGGISTASAYST